MTNKRKSKAMDFTFTGKNTKDQTRKSMGFDFQPKTQKTMQEKPEEIIQEIKLEKETKKDEEQLKPSLKLKKAKEVFKLQLKEDIIEENQFQPVKFDLKNDNKKSFKEISNLAPKIPIDNPENEKKSNNFKDKFNKPKEIILNPPKKPFSGKKMIIPPTLSIDTEQINENYSYGGEKGKKLLLNMDELSEEYREIAELAVLCVKYMSKFIIINENVK